ncbi:helix-turn-helix domain-containing protein [Photobacterium damselae]|uniref:helix-turn-helix domain-containing protein n=1 Tax=Photobacterium damselae TaxID=38293 RepID=UPI001F16B79A|nr:helix-turn-helix transcriptional regulator [Photobacterium damselae]UKA29482.1 helix-turn-helix transcriptional regulator [Photobacterium damselae subsp. damselae]
MTIRSDIGKVVKEHRKDLGLTQKQVSELSSINKTTISEIENSRFIGAFDIFDKVIGSIDLEFIVRRKVRRIRHLYELEELFGDD